MAKLCAMTLHNLSDSFLAEGLVNTICNMFPLRSCFKYRLSCSVRSGAILKRLLYLMFTVFISKIVCGDSSSVFCPNSKNSMSASTLFISSIFCIVEEDELSLR